jgi:hypothetical protein
MQFITVKLFLTKTVPCGSIHVELVVDKVALGQIFLTVFRLFPVNIIPPWLTILIYNYGG